ncbi:hypothetical protein E2493_17175 [Sphingomonas parva]|uniref:Tetratricopeptide repeat protein n=1 Tax=Sphingomonas parva TaxID=2555898 RepID=A0A4Y8ZRI8_9SPHN|nr:hypothetical protein [Sphingomonas parva]TFI57026.1 hypothetical protein E2493_17175 [Sphingomonas parva]
MTYGRERDRRRTITRHAVPPKASLVSPSNLAALRIALERQGPPGTLLVADLWLGAWQGQSLARQFAAQLGLPEPDAVQPLAAPNLRPGATPDYSDTVARVVDAETSGDRLVTAALDNALRLIEAADAEREPAVFVIILPAVDSPGWEREDLLLARFLAEAARDGPHRLVLASFGGGQAPPGWELTPLPARPLPPPPPRPPELLARIPGPISPADAATLAPDARPDEGMLLRGGALLVEPAARQGATPAGAHRAIAAASDGWLRAYALLRHGPTANDVPFLCAEAAQRFAEGGYGIARRLLEAARSAASGVVTPAAVELQLQGMRIALMDFEAAAAAADPDPRLPTALRGVLLQCKAWGLVMTGEAEQAEPRFSAAIELLKSEVPERQFLYLLNIAALNRLRLGRIDDALALECAIEQSLAGLERPDWHLVYINCLNLSRLYRRLGDVERAAAYVDTAFAGTLGLRSVSDLVYRNVCRAQIDCQAARREEAFLGWLRAALHWAAGEVPEALAPRVARAILGAPSAPAPERLAEAVAAALLRQLGAAAKAAGIDEWQEGGEPGRPPVFTGAPDLPPGAIAAGASGWGVLASSAPLAPACRGPEFDRLGAALGGYIGRCAPEAAGAPTYGIDTRGGTELPRTAAELLESGCRYEASSFVFDGRRLTLTDPERRRLRLSRRVRLGDGLDRIARTPHGFEARFKRYRPPYPLDTAALRLLDRIDGGSTVAEVAIDGADLGEQALALLDALEAAAVIKVELG